MIEQESASINENVTIQSSILNPKVSVVILNYNGEHFIKRCLKTVLEDDYEPKEIILVDNASHDKSLEIAQDFADHIQIIRNTENYGFPKGCNIGIDASNGEIIVLLNVDTAVRKDWLKELVEPFIYDQSVGITGSKLFFLDGKRLQFAGGGMHANCLTYHEGYGEHDAPEYNIPKEVEYITGASMAIRRKLLNEIDGLDEGFPLYFEDIDICFTARRLGYKTLYRPGSVVLHFETFGTPKQSHTYYYKYHRGRIRFLLKHFGLRYFIVTFLPSEIIWWFKPKVYKQFLPLFKAYITQIPKAPYFWFKGFLKRRKQNEVISELNGN